MTPHPLRYAPDVILASKEHAYGDVEVYPAARRTEVESALGGVIAG
jgi:hypothetical protein